MSYLAQVQIKYKNVVQSRRERNVKVQWKLLSKMCIDEKCVCVRALVPNLLSALLFCFRFALSSQTNGVNKHDSSQHCNVGILCGLIASKCAIIIPFCFHLMMLFIICFRFVVFGMGKVQRLYAASLSVNLISLSNWVCERVTLNEHYNNIVSIFVSVCIMVAWKQAKKKMKRRKNPNRYAMGQRAIKSTHYANWIALAATFRHISSVSSSCSCEKLFCRSNKLHSKLNNPICCSFYDQRKFVFVKAFSQQKLNKNHKICVSANKRGKKYVAHWTIKNQLTSISC